MHDATDGGPHIVDTRKHIPGINDGIVVVFQDIVSFMAQSPNIVGTKECKSENNQEQKS
jgi:hypothetical protein